MTRATGSLASRFIDMTRGLDPHSVQYNFLSRQRNSTTITDSRTFGHQSLHPNCVLGLHGPRGGQISIVSLQCTLKPFDLQLNTIAHTRRWWCARRKIVISPLPCRGRGISSYRSIPTAEPEFSATTRVTK